MSSCQVIACDVCGCASAGSLSGIWATSPGNFIGLQGRWVKFRSLDTGLGSADDEFYLAELRGRWQVSPRWQVFAILPYGQSSRLSEGQQFSQSGLGDASIMSMFRLHKSTGLKAAHQVQVGGGVKLPTGEYAFNAFDETSLPANFQLGTRSWDFLLRGVYTLRVSKWGAALDMNSRINTVNPEGYQFGHQAAGMAYVSRQFGTGEPRSLTPFLGMYGERVRADRLNGINQHGTGGQGAFLLAGVEAKWNPMSVSANIFLPVAHAYADGEAEPGPRAAISLNYLF
ncbi:MAG: hypothetical protein AAGI38_06735 [Bacteroidota bacterium]